MYRSTKVKSLYIRSKHFTFFFIIFEFEEQDPRGCFNSSMFTIRTNVLFNKSYIFETFAISLHHFRNWRSKIQLKRMLQFFNILQFVQMYCSTKVTHSKHSSFFFIIFEFEEQDPIKEDASILQHSILQFLQKLYIRNIRHFSSSFSNSRIQSKRMLQFFNVLFYNSYKYIVQQTSNQ